MLIRQERDLVFDLAVLLFFPPCMHKHMNVSDEQDYLTMPLMEICMPRVMLMVAVYPH